MNEWYLVVLASAALFTGGCRTPDGRGATAHPAGAPAYRFPSAPRGTPDVDHALALVARDRRSADAHCKLGLAYYQTANYQKAAEELRVATRLSPDRVDPDAYFYLGFSLEALGALQDARDTFRQLTQRNLAPHDLASAYAFLGDLYIDLGDLSGAERVYHESLRHDPHCWSASMALADLAESTNRPAEARKYRADAMHQADTPGERSRLHSAIGQHAQQRGDTSEAIAEYHTAIMYSTRNRAALAGLNTLEPGFRHDRLFAPRGAHKPGMGFNLRPTVPYMTVLKVGRGSPAAAAGIRAGDLVLAIDGVAVQDVSADMLREFAHKPKGSEDVLLIRHRGEAASHLIRYRP